MTASEIRKMKRKEKKAALKVAQLLYFLLVYVIIRLLGLGGSAGKATTAANRTEQKGRPRCRRRSARTLECPHFAQGPTHITFAIDYFKISVFAILRINSELQLLNLRRRSRSRRQLSSWNHWFYWIVAKSAPTFSVSRSIIVKVKCLRHLQVSVTYCLNSTKNGVLLEKPLPMLQCLKRGSELDPENPKLHVCRVKFLKFCKFSYIEWWRDRMIDYKYCTKVNFKIKMKMKLNCNWRWKQWVRGSGRRDFVRNAARCVCRDDWSRRAQSAVQG